MSFQYIPLRDRFPAEMFELLDEVRACGTPPFKENDPEYDKAPWPKFGTFDEEYGWGWWSTPAILEEVTKEEMLLALAEIKDKQTATEE